MTIFFGNQATNGKMVQDLCRGYRWRTFGLDGSLWKGTPIASEPRKKRKIVQTQFFDFGYNFQAALNPLIGPVRQTPWRVVVKTKSIPHSPSSHAQCDANREMFVFNQLNWLPCHVLPVFKHTPDAHACYSRNAKPFGTFQKSENLAVTTPCLTRVFISNTRHR